MMQFVQCKTKSDSLRPEGHFFATSNCSCVDGRDVYLQMEGYRRPEIQEGEDGNQWIAFGENAEPIDDLLPDAIDEGLTIVALIYEGHKGPRAKFWAPLNEWWYQYELLCSSWEEERRAYDLLAFRERQKRARNPKECRETGWKEVGGKGRQRIFERPEGLTDADAPKRVTCYEPKAPEQRGKGGGVRRELQTA